MERVSVVFFTDHEAAETLGGLDLDVIAVLPTVRYHRRSRSVTECDVYLGEFAQRELAAQAVVSLPDPPPPLCSLGLATTLVGAPCTSG